MQETNPDVANFHTYESSYCNKGGSRVADASCCQIKETRAKTETNKPVQPKEAHELTASTALMKMVGLGRWEVK